MLGVSNFDGCVRTSVSNNVTIRNNVMTASPGVVGRSGIETSRGDNILVSNNKISKLVTPINTLESQIRIVGNGIIDADFHGIIIDSHKTANVSGNNIARCGEAGILAVSTTPISATNELRIENNILRDCGLTGYEAVILVDSVSNFPGTIAEFHRWPEHLTFEQLEQFGTVGEKNEYNDGCGQPSSSDCV